MEVVNNNNRGNNYYLIIRVPLRLGDGVAATCDKIITSHIGLCKQKKFLQQKREL